MTPQSIDRAREDRCFLIAVNDSYLLAPDADMLFAADADWWLAHPEALEFKGRKMVAQKQRIEGAEYVKPRPIPGGGNSALRAAHLACDIGASCIYLYGVDLRDDALTHWHGLHKKGLRNPTRQVFAAARKAWQLFAEDPKRPPVYNCSPISSLECFPKC